MELGEYEVSEKDLSHPIGQGSYCTVFLCRKKSDKKDEKNYVAKRILYKNQGVINTEKDMVKELGKFESPYIAAAPEVVEKPGEGAYFIMPFYNKGTLDEMIDNNKFFLKLHRIKNISKK